MPSYTDVISTVFQVRGLSALVGAYKSAQDASNRLAAANQNLAYKIAQGGKIQGAVNAVYAAQRNLTNSNIKSLQVMGQVGQQAFSTLVSAAKQAVDAYVEFGKQIMNIKQLTGASTSDAIGLTNLFKGAGIEDSSAIKDILHASKGVFSGDARNAMGMIGVSPNPNQSGTALINEIIDKLALMQDGIRKTDIEMRIFGTKNVEVLQPLLRMSSEAREKINQLSSEFDGRGLSAIQRFTEQSQILGLTVMQKLVYPLAAALLPALTRMITSLVWVIDEISAFNKALGNFPLYVAMFSAMAGSLYAMASGARAAAVALLALEAVQKRGIIVKGLSAVASGNPYAIAAAVVAGIGAYFALPHLQKMFGGGDDQAQATDKFAGAVDKFGSTIDLMNQGWEKLNRGGIPTGLNDIDAASLQRKFALGAIG